jgi:hypothetical protein
MRPCRLVSAGDAGWLGSSVGAVAEPARVAWRLIGDASIDDGEHVR